MVYVVLGTFVVLFLGFYLLDGFGNEPWRKVLSRVGILVSPFTIALIVLTVPARGPEHQAFLISLVGPIAFTQYVLGILFGSRLDTIRVERDGAPVDGLGNHSWCTSLALAGLFLSPFTTGQTLYLIRDYFVLPSEPISLLTILVLVCGVCFVQTLVGWYVGNLLDSGRADTH